MNEVMEPTRTASGLVEFRKFLYHTKDKDVDDVLRRTTIAATEFIPLRSTEDSDMSESTDVDSKATDKDDSSYNIIFNYDDADKIDKKTTKTDGNVDELYDELHRDIDNNDIQPEKEIKEIEVSSPKAIVKSTEMYDEKDYDDIVNATENISTTQNAITLTTTEAVTKEVLKEGLREKHRPMCSMLKLRQLSFNSPRTLPEVS